MSEFRFSSISLEQINGQDFIKFCTYIDIDKMLVGIATCNFSQAAELWPLIQVDWDFPHTWPFNVQHEKC